MVHLIGRLQRVVFLVPVLLSMLCPARAAGVEKGWHVYLASRFGVIVEYPDVFTVRDRPPDNGDGQSFRTEGGDVTLRVFGSYNVDGSSSAALMQSSRQAGTAYTYAKATEAWFVLSGTSRGKISYMRCKLGASDVIGCFELEYPAAASSVWSPIIGRMSRSLNLVHS